MVRGFLQLTLSRIAQGTVDDEMRVRWLRGPVGRELVELAGPMEQAATHAGELGMRVVRVRTGVVLAADGGALAKMLPPFRLGVGGPVAGGRQYISWIHTEDRADRRIERAVLREGAMSG